MSMPTNLLACVRLLTAAPTASRAFSHAYAARWANGRHFSSVIFQSLFSSRNRSERDRDVFCREFSVACALPAGHSHWANIKVGKGLKDNERAYNFNKLGNLMRAAVRTGGVNPDTNHLLARLINEAKTINMPKDTLQRILSPRATGDLKPHFFEIKGPGSSLILVQVLTPNARRTEIDIRTVLRKFGGQLLTNAGLMSYFQQKGIVIANKHDTNEETAIEDGIRIGAEEAMLEDAVASEGKDKIAAQFRFECDPMELVNVKRGLEGAGYSIVYAEAEFLPLQTMELTGKDAEAYKTLCEKIEEQPEVSQVFTNVV